MDNLKMMKETLVSCVQAQMANIGEVNTKELGEAIDMIKDLAEASYYCAIVESMEKAEKENESMPQSMYYTPGGNRQSSMPNSRSYYDSMTPMMYMPNAYREYEYPIKDIMHDAREGRSPMARKMYMEQKEKSPMPNRESHIKELDKYMKELSNDITEMIENATPDEKALLQQKINTLATKIM